MSGSWARRWFAALVVAACAIAGADARAKPKPVQKAAPLCPVSGNPAKENITADYKGGKLFFDSEESKQTFAKETGKYAAAGNFQLAATSQAQQVKCPITGKNLGPTAMSVNGVGVCCGGCRNKLANMNAQQQLELVFGPNFDRWFVIRGQK